jgi:ATP-binding cassette subfamily B protein
VQNDQVSDNTAMSKNKQLSILLELKRFIRPYSGRAFMAAVALIFTAGLTLSIGQGVRQLIDQGFTGQSSEQLKYAVQFILILTVLISFGTYARFYLVSWIGERVSADIRLAVFNHVISLHPGYFETTKSGDIMSRLTTDTTLLQSIVGSSLSMAIRSALMFIGALFMLFATNIKLTLIVLCSVPFILMPILFYGRKVRTLSRLSQDSMSEVGSYAGEAIEHIKTVQSFTQEHTEKNAFKNEVEHAFKIGRRRIQQRATLIAGVIIIVFSAITGMLWVGGNDVISGQMSGGDLGAFVFYAILVASSLATISEVIGELQRAAGATERLIEILQVKNIIETSQAASLEAPSLAAQIIIKGVYFSYPSRPALAAIENLSLTIETGKVLALVGPSGAGKSTLFDLIQRFYDPQRGKILLDNVDIREISARHLRQKMAIVPQQPALFSSDVMHNIRYGNQQASDEQVIEAAKKAHAHEFIIALPDGYNSFLGERGVRLSGGQKQRIAIARAILKDPEILLLDEATSALDSESEYYVQQALDTLMKNRTTIIIAHRLSTIQHADHIAVLDEGKLIEVGDHQQLMQSCELYQRLVKLQFNSI